MSLTPEHAGILMIDATTARFVARAHSKTKSVPREDAFCNIVIQRDTRLINRAADQGRRGPVQGQGGRQKPDHAVTTRAGGRGCSACAASDHHALDGFVGYDKAAITLFGQYRRLAVPF